MALHDKSTMTKDSDSLIRRYCRLRLQKILSFIGSLLIPLMLGIFTVVITFHQQNIAVQQRREDRQLEREQREQDLNMSREQRLQDLHMFALQREQDLNISREQRKLDREIAEAKRIQDNDLAEKQRKISDAQRVHELELAQQQLRDTLLVAYMNDIAILLKENNGTLTTDPTIAIISRAKTVTAIRQLDIPRKTEIIKFLYDARQLINGANPLDLSGAELSGMDFSIHNNFYRNLRNLSLVGAILRNCSFSRQDLMNANFSGADLTDARFEKCNLNNADISRTIIVRADFSTAELRGARFDYARARRTIFISIQASNATFIASDIELSLFHNCNCRNVNFHRAKLEKSDFSSAQLQHTIFHGANLAQSQFFNAFLTDSNLKEARLKGTNFTKSSCEGAIFTKADLLTVHLVQAKLKDVDFSNLNMNHADFSGADLTLATLFHTKLSNANFNETIIMMTNFSFASMKNAFISDEQLFNALSLRRTTLPNGTIMNDDRNTLYNGHAKCNVTLLNDHWKISPTDAIVILPKHDFPQDCIFVNRINGSSSMSQRVNLTKYKPLTLINRAVFVLSVRGGGKISSIRIDDHQDRLISVGNFIQESDFLTLRARYNTHQPKVTVEFSGYGWCDDIDLTVEMVPRVL